MVVGDTGFEPTDLFRVRQNSAWKRGRVVRPELCRVAYLWRLRVPAQPPGRATHYEGVQRVTVENGCRWKRWVVAPWPASLTAVSLAVVPSLYPH
jgi:hypothetical protein